MKGANNIFLVDSILVPLMILFYLGLGLYAVFTSDVEIGGEDYYAFIEPLIQPSSHEIVGMVMCRLIRPASA